MEVCADTPPPVFAIRAAAAADAAAIGTLFFDAFDTLDRASGQPPFVSSVAASIVGAELMLARADACGFVAVRAHDHRIIGASFEQRMGGDVDAVTGVGGRSTLGLGPVAVHPDVQLGGVGRALLDAGEACTAAAGRGRLTQDAFNNQSLCLYLSYGFHFAAPLSFISRPAGVVGGGTAAADAGSPPPSVVVEWPPTVSWQCEMVSERNHGASKLHLELLGFVRPLPFTALVARAVGNGDVIGYIEDKPSYPHGCSRATAVLQLLIEQLVVEHPTTAVNVGVPFDGSAQLLLALRRQGFAQVRPVNLLVRGDFPPPQTEAYLSSSSY
jgi:predicted N-acetyltransferase YhbS